MLSEMGVLLEVIQRRLGHASIRTTAVRGHEKVPTDGQVEYPLVAK